MTDDTVDPITREIAEEIMRQGIAFLTALDRGDIEACKVHLKRLETLDPLTWGSPCNKT